MLRDGELKALYPEIVVGGDLGDDPDAPRSPVQPASIDLSIGNIYVPGKDPAALGGVHTPRARHVLGEGETAVVTTLETLQMPSDIGGVGFPPTRISNAGILLTNPGHIDPGYRGRLSFTAVNLGREPYTLERGARIVTLVLFKMSRDADSDFENRNPQPGYRMPVEPERMAALAHDMLNVGDRIQRKVAEEEQKTRRWAMIVPFLVAAVVALGGLVIPLLLGHLSGLDDVRHRVTQIEEGRNLDDLERRLRVLEERIAEQDETSSPESP